MQSRPCAQTPRWHTHGISRVFLHFFLKDPLGELVVEADLLHPLVYGPQGTSSGELAKTNWSGGAVSNLSRD